MAITECIDSLQHHFSYSRVNHDNERELFFVFWINARSVGKIFKLQIFKHYV